MAFDWELFLTVARKLIDPASNPEEPEFRSSVSRAYYSAFHVALDYAEKNEHFIRRGYAGDHGALIAHFKRSNKQRVFEKLKDLRGWREQCDYDEQIDNLPFMTEYAIPFAQLVIDILKPKPKNP
jgi:uncharacterized protein (UPF0332 family)